MKKISLALIPALLLSFYAAIYFLQGNLLFFPNQQKFLDCPPILSLKAQSVEMDFRGQHIRLYLLEHEHAEAYVVVFHGNAGSACDRSDYIDELGRDNLNVAIAEYPGYSNDPSVPTENSVLENAAAVFHYVESINSLNLKIFLYGESLGTGVATKIAAENNVGGLLLQSPYTSITDVAAIHYPYLPVRALLRFRFEAEAWANAVKAKTLVFVADQDEVIPPEMSRKQANNFLYLTKIETYSGRGHNDLHSENEPLWKIARAFIHEVAGQK